MKRITLRQLAEMFLSLPEEILNKEIYYLDLAHMGQDELNNLKANLLRRTEDVIQECEN